MMNIPMTVRAVTLALVFLIAGSALASDRAICAVCGPREGAGPEEVKATATLKGKTFYFCSVECKIAFLKDPEAFLVTDAGQPAPSFRLTGADGTVVSLESLRGKVVLLDFWATFCPPCLAALPDLQAMHAKYASQGFVVVGLTVEDRPTLVRKATAAAGVRYPVVEATPAVWNAYKVTALPALVLVGRDGRIVRRFGGEADRSILIGEIERALR